MSSSDDEFVIQKVPVYGREELPKGIAGWSWSEMALMAGAVVLSWWLLRSKLMTISAAATMYLYLRYLKRVLPEKFVTRWVRHNLRHELTYHSMARDRRWRPPIVQD